MSEYQYIAFRALDKPVERDDLKFMRAQSSRAEVTPWSFTNEYHFGDFKGNVKAMLRRGYDMHLHYANFGIRALQIRLPQGLPDEKAASEYLDGDSLRFETDSGSDAGILTIAPYYEPGHLPELWDVHEMFERLVPMRQEILQGDLRPFYIASLGVCFDLEHGPAETDAPAVPSGLANLTPAQEALAEFYGISEALLAAAAETSPPLPAETEVRRRYADWIAQQPQARRDGWLVDLMTGPAEAVKSRLFAACNADLAREARPLSEDRPTLGDLQSRANVLNEEAERAAAAKAERDHAELLAAMASDPKTYLEEVDNLVASRSISAYRKAAELLSALRDALVGTDQADLAEAQAQRLKRDYSRRHHLTAALRDAALLPK